MQDIKFEQLALIEGGHQHITVSLTLHFDGTSDLIQVGYEITNTMSMETIELGTLGVLDRSRAILPLATVLGAMIGHAERHLSPF